jgi:hypothetical protein
MTNKYEMQSNIYDGGVYVLKDPKTKIIKYVGHSKDLKRRKLDHCVRDRQLMYYQNGERSSYLAWELSLDTAPIFETVLNCDEEVLVKWEYFIMGFLTSRGFKLLNSESNRPWLWEKLLKENANLPRKKTHKGSRKKIKASGKIRKDARI